MQLQFFQPGVRFFTILLLAGGLLSSCVSVGPDRYRVEGMGTVKYIDLEGGFYALVGEEGEKYDPVNLPSWFEEDGLRVRYIARKCDDCLTFRMWGTPIAIIEIHKLETPA